MFESTIIKTTGISLLFFCFFCLNSFAQNDQSFLADSDWPMRGQNLLHSGRSASSYPASNTLKWSYKTGGSVSSSPAIGLNGTAYFCSANSYLYAMNSDGALKWKYQIGIQAISSPAIGVYGTVYVGSRDHFLYAIDSDKGTLKWKFQAGDEINSSPSIGTDGSVYFGSNDGYLYAISSFSGTLKWKFQTGGIIFSSPAVGSDGSIYFGSSDSYLYALAKEGWLRWKLQTAGMVSSSPAIGADGTIYVGCNNTSTVFPSFYAINKWGTVRWMFTTGYPIESSPAIGADGTVYIGNEDGLYALSPYGSIKWKYQTGQNGSGANVWSSPAIGGDGTIYVGCNNKNFYSIKSDGTLKWKYLTGGQVYSSPSIASDGTVYVGSDDGSLYAFLPENQIPAITLTSPNGGDYWVAGTSQYITWTGKNILFSMGIKIEYSTNNGAAWNTIIDNLSYFKYSYPWVVPKINSNSCLIRISDSANPSFNDASDAVFTMEIGPSLSDSAWPMRGQNALHAGRGTSVYSASDIVKWKYLTGNKVNSSPAIGKDGTMYVGSYDLSLHAI
jgi:outer membrane protein assembly factor BamB